MHTDANKALSGENLKGLRITSLDEDEDEEEKLQHEDEIIDEDEDDDDEGEEAEPLVKLGFVDKPENSWSFDRQVFPSKAGGVPAWLDPINLPSEKSSLCDICQEPLQFVLQVYAPLFEKESTFHRTLFVFMCPSNKCLLRDQHEQWRRPPEKTSRSVKVFRCQLPRENPFYSSENPKYDGTDRPSGDGAPLCNWCGTWKGNKVCSSCRRMRYCSQQHQVKHWHSGHKIECRQLSLFSQLSNSKPCNSGTTSTEVHKVASSTLWPEYEMTHEDESEYDTEMSEDDGHANSLIPKGRTNDAGKSLLDFEGVGDRKSCATFLEHIRMAPTQILRYCRSADAKPLWPLSSGRPSTADIPQCNYCGSPMSFEFQILSKLLYYFHVKDDQDSLDWATIAAFTCEASCEASISYKEEFAWVQLWSPSTNLP